MKKSLALAATILLLWAFFAQCVTSMVAKSPTVDEQIHLTRGYVYLTLGDLRLKIGHPILANTLNAVPVRGLIDLSIPIDHSSWKTRKWSVFADRFIWQEGNPVAKIFFLGRLVTVAIGLAGGALVFRWTRECFGLRSGLLALTLFTFDPNLIAHSRLVTNDLAIAVFALAATYGLWRYFVTRHWRFLLVSGLAFGCAQGAKYSAAVLVPVFIVLAPLWNLKYRQRDASTWNYLLRSWGKVLIIFLLAGLTIWVTYGFRIAYLDQIPLPLPIPAPDYFDDLLWQSRYLGREHYAFLMGHISPTGWWYYDIIAILFKTPLPVLLFTILSLAYLWSKHRQYTDLLIPIGFFLVAAVYSPLDIGFRYLLPLFPYLYVYISQLNFLIRWPRGLPLATIAAWLMIISLLIYPHYLSYFNILAGGPDNGWRYLTDSNIDWGQDLPALHDLIQRRNLGRVKLAYFGTAHPSYYDIDFEPLPTWEPAPEQGNPFTKTYYPHKPSPGVYAISATLLQGVVMEPEQWDTYVWFRDKEPFAKAGYSIFLYRVEPTGPPANVVLSGIQIDHLASKTFANFGTNDIRLRWFDAQTSLVVPNRPTWYVTEGADLTSWSLEDAPNCITDETRDCTLYLPDPDAHAAVLDYIEALEADSEVWFSSALAPSPEEQLSPLSLPINLGDQLQFLGYELDTCNVQSATCNLSISWRVTAPPDGPRAIFVHLLAPDGQVAAQWDGLDVPVKGWRVGDTILQKASFDLPPDLSSGQYWLQTGVYNPDTMKRLPVLTDGERIADRILLSPVEVTGQ